MPEQHQGPYGQAERLSIPDIPRAAQTVGHWLITAPAFHPLWGQYYLICVRLDDDVPGFPPPHRQFDGATHELLVPCVKELAQFDHGSDRHRAVAGHRR